MALGCLTVVAVHCMEKNFRFRALSVFIWSFGNCVNFVKLDHIQGLLTFWAFVFEFLLSS